MSCRCRVLERQTRQKRKTTEEEEGGEEEEEERPREGDKRVRMNNNKIGGEKETEQSEFTNHEEEVGSGAHLLSFYVNDLTQKM